MPAATIGHETRNPRHTYFSHYTNMDELDANEADKKRKHTSSTVFMGS